MILTRDRCPEQRHESVAEELIDRAFVAVHLGKRDTEEAIDHAVKFLRPQLRRQAARPDHVAEQHGHLLALTLDGTPDGQDLLTDVPRGVTRRSGRSGHRAPAFQAELGTRRQYCAARGARNSYLRSAMQTEARLARILLPAPRAPHRGHP